MKKLVLLLFVAVMFTNLFAKKQEGKWQLNLKKLDINISNFTPSFDDDIKTVTNSQVVLDKNFFTGSNLELALDYLQKKYNWNFTIIADYSKSKVTPVGQKAIETVASDNLVYSTQYEYKVGEYKNKRVAIKDLYAYANLAWDTEIEAPTGGEKEKILRYTFGAKFNKFKIFDTVSLGKFFERNISANNAKTDGYTLDLTNNYKLLKNTLATKFNWKYHLDGNNDTKDQFRYESRLESSISIPLNENLFIAPFLNTFFYKMKEIDKTGHSILVGVKFSFNKLFDLSKKSKKSKK